jgi:hypothetical protein
MHDAVISVPVATVVAVVAVAAVAATAGDIGNRLLFWVGAYSLIGAAAIEVIHAAYGAGVGE